VPCRASRAGEPFRSQHWLGRRRSARCRSPRDAGAGNGTAVVRGVVAGAGPAPLRLPHGARQLEAAARAPGDRRPQRVAVSLHDLVEQPHRSEDQGGDGPGPGRSGRCGAAAARCGAVRAEDAGRRQPERSVVGLRVEVAVEGDRVQLREVGPAFGQQAPEWAAAHVRWAAVPAVRRYSWR
jgi:hypothetical protein